LGRGKGRRRKVDRELRLWNNERTECWAARVSGRAGQSTATSGWYELGSPNSAEILVVHVLNSVCVQGEERMTHTNPFLPS